MIVAMAGLPGTGKSTLALALAPKLPAIVLNKDTVRVALFPPAEIEHSMHQDDFIVGMLLQIAEYYFQKDPGRHVILDGRTFSKKAQVDALVKYTREHQRELKVIYCTCSDEVARARIERDTASGGHPATDRDFNLYLRLQAETDPLEVPYLFLDTREPLATCVLLCLEYLGKHSENTFEEHVE